MSLSEKSPLDFKDAAAPRLFRGTYFQSIFCDEHQKPKYFGLMIPKELKTFLKNWIRGRLLNAKNMSPRSRTTSIYKISGSQCL